MNIVIAMDSFKGSMNSLEAGQAAKNGILKVFPHANITILPVADGGEGTLEAICHNKKAVTVDMTVIGPLGEDTLAQYTILDNRTAVIEMAQAAGLPLVPPEKRNPMVTTTAGVGQMIADAIHRNCRQFIMGIGGSATNDGGVGMLQALGYQFMDSDGNEVRYGAKGLADIHKISSRNALPQLCECTFRVACDVTNPLTGENGCSAVFAPQKGASPEDVQKMDLWMTGYAQLAEDWRSAANENTAKIDRNTPGAGAAGGMGFALQMFLNASLESGIDIVLSENGIRDFLQNADFILTGEGCIDSQTLMGKACAGIARLAHKCKKKVIAFGGCIGTGAELCLEEKLFDAYCSITPNGMSTEDAMKKETAKNNMTMAVETFFANYIKTFPN